MEVLKQEVLDIINNIKILTDNDRYLLGDSIEQTFRENDDWRATNYHVNKVGDRYFVYGLGKVNPDVSVKVMVDKFVTTDKELVIKILVHDLLYKHTWDKVVAKYSDAYYVDYNDEVQDFEENLLAKLLKYIPEKYKDFDIHKECNFESFLDSNIYKEWLYS